MRKSVVLPLFYADDSQLYVHFKATCQTMHLAINKVKSCCDNVISWMCSNLLKLNQEKTEVVIFGSKPHLTKLDIECIRIGDSYIKPSDTACNIGIQLDCNMNMRCQVNKIVSLSWLHLRNFFQIRSYLTQKATESLVHSFITSRLDLQNRLLHLTICLPLFYF